jgi:hypothetical protein
MNPSEPSGFGIRIVSSPGIISSQTESEEGLRTQIRELEEKMLGLELQNKMLQAIVMKKEKDGKSQTFTT